MDEPNGLRLGGVVVDDAPPVDADPAVAAARLDDRLPAGGSRVFVLGISHGAGPLLVCEDYCRHVRELQAPPASGAGRTSLLVPCVWSGSAPRAWDNGAVSLSHLASQKLGQSPFPPIADYGFLSDCEVTALVAPSGNVEWLCLPRLDSPSVFGAILDRHAGGFRVGPGRRGGARGSALPARHHGPRDELEHADGLDHRARCVARRAVASRGRAVAQSPAGAHRLRRRPRPAAHRALRQR